MSQKAEPGEPLSSAVTMRTEALEGDATSAAVWRAVAANANVARFSGLWAMALALVLVLSGCATAEPTTPALTGDPLTDAHNAIASGPPRDRVLWQYRAGLAALRQGQFSEAKTFLDDALARMANILGKDPNSRKARGYFTQEARKTFLGEPYERVMAYYYRGILYWMDGEPDNARACFRSAAIEDADITGKTYVSDYVLLDYLDGLATAKLGDDGADAFQRAQANAKLSQPPALNSRANALFFVDYGQGPTKIATGQYGEQLDFRPGPSAARGVQIRIGPRTLQLRPFDDLYFQATTRGGRVMDHILANKAQFKEATDAVGNVALVGGAVMAMNRDTQAAGLGVMAAGLLSKVLSEAARPEADTRGWDTLPLYLSFAAVELPPGEHTATVEFLDDANRILPGLSKTVSFRISEGPGDRVIYVSDQSKTPSNL